MTVSEYLNNHNIKTFRIIHSNTVIYNSRHNKELSFFLKNSIVIDVFELFTGNIEIEI